MKTRVKKYEIFKKIEYSLKNCNVKLIISKKFIYNSIFVSRNLLDNLLLKAIVRLKISKGCFLRKLNSLNFLGDVIYLTHLAVAGTSTDLLLIVQRIIYEM